MTPNAQAEALFVSSLQPSEHVTSAEINAMIIESLTANGGQLGCAERMAAEYGEHPESACLRMRWALSLVSSS